MKQTKKLTRAHYSYLTKKGIQQGTIDRLRFYRDVNGEPVFSLDGELVTASKGKMVPAE